MSVLSTSFEFDRLSSITLTSTFSVGASALKHLAITGKRPAQPVSGFTSDNSYIANHISYDTHINKVCAPSIITKLVKHRIRNIVLFVFLFK